MRTMVDHSSKQLKPKRTGLLDPQMAEQPLKLWKSRMQGTLHLPVSQQSSYNSFQISLSKTWADQQAISW